MYFFATLYISVHLLYTILQHIFNDVEDFLDNDEWIEDDLVLTSPDTASNHDGLKSPPPYQLPSTLAEFGNTAKLLQSNSSVYIEAIGLYVGILNCGQFFL